MRKNKIYFAVVVAMVLAISAAAFSADKPKGKTNSGFSFAAYGDSRTMMYLPRKSDQKEEATKLMVEMFSLVLPEKIATEVVRKDVKLTYDPASG